MDVSKLNLAEAYDFASELQTILRTNKIEQQEVCQFIKMHPVHFSRKIQNPDSWKIGHLRQIEIYLKTRFAKQGKK